MPALGSSVASRLSRRRLLGAGNELPDMILTQSVNNFPALLEKRFAPLDEYLSGDAIKEYPNLANIPPRRGSR